MGYLLRIGGCPIIIGGCDLLSGGRGVSRQLDWLNERSVSCRVPHGESHPLLISRIEWYLEVMLAERGKIGQRNNLPIGLRSISPDYLCELQWKGPFDVRGDGALIAAS
jgi:hypothetical protein